VAAAAATLIACAEVARALGIGTETFRKWIPA
jgi:hypothetical protein